MAIRTTTQTRLLTFQTAGRTFCVPLNQTLEILLSEGIRRVPLTLPYVEGVKDYRGTLVAVYDLRKRFETDEESPAGLLLVIQGSSTPLCLHVDAVGGIATVEEGEILSPPLKLMGIQSRFLIGIIKQDRQVLPILNIPALFANPDSIRLEIA
ncbi:MAG: chemotaxis protein CheW [Nitrospirae bacterium]|nr:chemotaxis protein CheW [Nitrospirota bacterium]